MDCSSLEVPKEEDVDEVLQKKRASFPSHSSCSSPSLPHLSQALLVRVWKDLTLSLEHADDRDVVGPCPHLISLFLSLFLTSWCLLTWELH